MTAWHEFAKHPPYFPSSPLRQRGMNFLRHHSRPTVVTTTTDPPLFLRHHSRPTVVTTFPAYRPTRRVTCRRRHATLRGSSEACRSSQRHRWPSRCRSPPSTPTASCSTSAAASPRWWPLRRRTSTYPSGSWWAGSCRPWFVMLLLLLFRRRRRGRGSCSARGVPGVVGGPHLEHGWPNLSI
ncbi:unnamed protein product [Urochloa humidicola]